MAFMEEYSINLLGEYFIRFLSMMRFSESIRRSNINGMFSRFEVQWNSARPQMRAVYGVRRTSSRKKFFGEIPLYQLHHITRINSFCISHWPPFAVADSVFNHIVWTSHKEIHYDLRCGSPVVRNHFGSIYIHLIISGASRHFVVHIVLIAFDVEESVSLRSSVAHRCIGQPFLV